MKASTRAQLDSTVVEIELTLVSIIQGVALSFLIDSARHLISIKQIAFWPYIIAGLIVILIFWSRSVLHVITLIRWPLEFGHNFLYIACAFAEALLFTRLNNPIAWFALGALYAAIGWVLFVYDLRFLRDRETDAAGGAGQQLYASVTKDQWRNIQFLLPAVFFLNVGCALCIHAWPEFFLLHNGHAWLGLVQLLAFAGYLLYVLRFFKTLAPLIPAAREEWQSKTGELD